MAKKLILVVDDQPTASHMVENMLEKFDDYEIAIRDNCTRAISYVGNHDVDLVLMDVSLGDDSIFDGIETARLIMTKYGIPIIFFTSIDKPEVFTKSNLPAYFDVLNKPCDPKFLRLHIEIAIANNNLEHMHKALVNCFDSYLSLNTQPVIITTETGAITIMNTAAETMCNYTCSLTIGKNILDILQISPESAQSTSYFREFDELIAQEGNQLLLHNDGEILRIVVKIKKFTEKNNQTCYAIEFN